jgi:RNase P/RNase MRP subunit POP5
LLIEGSDLKKNVEKAILDFVGVLGFSKLGLSWIDEKNDSGIISINREMVDVVRASICVFPKKMEVKKVSGTLKSLRGK